MQINRAYRTELKPNNDQRTMLLKSAGTARFAYNWGLERKRDAMALNRKLAEDRTL
ncbi:MAG: helix-turn-helix domain-containing protein, partial [Thermoplasmata archaeon]|nr:helix-turn-helix domain-containing protein [Candidatus Sysuiplasma jiujiangense]